MPPVRPDLFEFEFDPGSIRNMRNRMQLSQAALADWLDMPVNTISRWETGATTPDAKALAAIWSIANAQGVEPEFFKQRRGSELNSRTNLIVLWEYQNPTLDRSEVDEEWQYLGTYIGCRFPKVGRGINGTLYASSSMERSGSVTRVLSGPILGPYTNDDESQVGLKIKPRGWLNQHQVERDARGVCADQPRNTILVLATGDASRATLLRELQSEGVDTYLIPTADDCPEALLDAVPVDNVIHRDAAFVVSECLAVIDELKTKPVTRAEFGNLCKDRLDDDSIYPQDVGFSRRNPYGSLLRWFETIGVVRVVPKTGKGKKVRIHRLR